MSSQDVAISRVDIQMDIIKDSDPRNEDKHLKSVIDESCLLKPAMAEEQEINKTLSPGTIISCIVQEPIQESRSSEKRSSPEPHAQHVVHDLYAHSLADNVSTQGTTSDVQEEEFRNVVRMGSSITSDEQSGNVRHVDELVPTRSSSFENSSEHMNSESQKGEMSKVMDDNVLIGHNDGDDTSKTESHLESSMTHGMEDLSHGEMIDRRNADSNLKLHMGSLDR
ncbi:uncharacterized protein LOC112502963 [Cynara cardunculus var. scolymus]|uniref:uncharacterized protein LOC112502963 n=1 Tax=Cynara cardunculus var. scolymus TaxID=59895 RepID=UPI000D626FAB|nr:uncharacterized protein LOC112502963 [Cynara cardunculus var. scolymus]XP_024962774.1 uncharacterized protein LOC112502963 [Cynara cardunculus var. scolymus]